MGYFRNTAEGGADTALASTGTGGDSGDAFTAISGSSTLTFSSAAAFTGKLGYRLAGVTGTQFINWDDVSASADGAMSFFFYLGALPSSQLTFLQIRSLGANVASLNINTSGQINAIAGTGSSFTAGALSASTFYRAEVQWSGFGTSSSSLQWQVYAGYGGSPILSTGVTGTTTVSTVQRIRLGKPADATTMTAVMYLDNIQANFGSAAVLGGLVLDANAMAIVADAVGTANDAVVLSGVFTQAIAEVAAGTGTAYDVTKAANLSASAFAGVASGVGEALFDSTGNSISLGYLVDDAIVGVGTAYDATVKIKSSSVEASGTGQAFNATVQIDQNGTTGSIEATGTGTAYNAQVFVLGTAVGQEAAAQGTALDATVLIEIRATQPVAPTAEALGTAFNATIDIDEHLPIYFTTPSVRERPYTRHGLWARTYLSRGRTVLKFGTSYKQFDDPEETDIINADKVYLGGRTYRIDKYEAAALTAAGYGAWISEAPEFTPIDI